MKKTSIALSALLLGGLLSAPASAAPLSSGTGIKAALETSAVDQVRHRKGHYNKRKWNRNRAYRKGYRAGRRYNHAPSGWRRYNSRPYGWHSRGCIVVGPVWFCP